MRKSLPISLWKLTLKIFELNIVFGFSNHPQSQGVIEAFNKTIQRALSAAYDKIK